MQHQIFKQDTFKTKCMSGRTDNEQHTDQTAYSCAAISGLP